VGGLWTLFSISEFFLCVLLFEKFHFDLEVSKFDFHFCVCLGFSGLFLRGFFGFFEVFEVFVSGGDYFCAGLSLNFLFCSADKRL